MARVRVGEVAAGEVQNAAERGDEHAGVISRGELVVHDGERPGRVADGVDRALEKRLADGHEKRGRDALARDVADGDIQVILVQKRKVVQVAADLPGRFERREKVEVLPFRVGREELGDDAELNLVRDGEFARDLLLGGGRRRQFVDVAAQVLAHPGETGGEPSDFVAAADLRELRVEIAEGKSSRRRCKLVERPCERDGQRHRRAEKKEAAAEADEEVHLVLPLEGRENLRLRNRNVEGPAGERHGPEENIGRDRVRRAAVLRHAALAGEQRVGEFLQRGKRLADASERFRDAEHRLLHLVVADRVGDVHSLRGKEHRHARFAEIQRVQHVADALKRELARDNRAQLSVRRKDRHGIGDGRGLEDRIVVRLHPHGFAEVLRQVVPVLHVLVVHVDGAVDLHPAVHAARARHAQAPGVAVAGEGNFDSRDIGIVVEERHEPPGHVAVAALFAREAHGRGSGEGLYPAEHLVDAVDRGGRHGLALFGLLGDEKAALRNLAEEENGGQNEPRSAEDQNRQAPDKTLVRAPHGPSRLPSQRWHIPAPI